MSARKAFAVLGLVLASLMVLCIAHAGETDQATKLTFSQSVQIPGQVLPPGTYWFMLDHAPGSHVIRIFGQDRLTLYATLHCENNLGSLRWINVVKRYCLQN